MGRMRSKPAMRALGFFLLIMGTGLAAWEWQIKLAEDRYDSKMACLGAFFAMAGVGTIVRPLDKDRLLAEHGVEEIRYFRHLPLFWKIWIFVCILSAYCNLALMSGN